MKQNVLSLFPLMVMFGIWQAHADEAWMLTRTVQPGDTLQATDIDLGKVDNPPTGLFATTRSPAGMDTRRRILAGHPLLERDVERHMLVRANNPVRVVWQSGAISMELEGRALQQGAAGDQIRVLNPASSRTLQGTVLPDGTIQVGY